MVIACWSRGSYDRVIAFCNTKNMTDRLTGLLQMRGISCAVHPRGHPASEMREKTLPALPRRGAAGAGGHRRGRPWDWTSTTWTPSFNYDVPDENGILYPPHRPHRPGQAASGAAYNLISSVTDDVRLDDIIRNSQYDITTITL